MQLPPLCDPIMVQQHSIKQEYSQNMEMRQLRHMITVECERKMETKQSCTWCILRHGDLGKTRQDLNPCDQYDNSYKMKPPKMKGYSGTKPF